MISPPHLTLRQIPCLYILAAVLLMSGCARTAPVSYYQLTAVGGALEETGSSVAGETVIGIGPVRLPEYLDRPQMVVRTGPNRVQLAERHRWVEPLGENIVRVLREDLAMMLNTEQLSIHPWGRDTRIAYQVGIDVVRFEGEGYRQGYLEAVWSIRDSDGGMLHPPLRSMHTVPAATPDHQGLAEALSGCVARLSREIGLELLRRLRETAN